MDNTPTTAPTANQHAVVVKAAAWALMAAAVVVGFLPVSAAGSSCGSPFVASSTYGAVAAVCADARNGRWPLIAVLGIVGLGLYVAGLWLTPPREPSRRP